MGLVNVNAVQILEIGLSLYLRLKGLYDIFILFFKNFGVFPVAAIVVVPVIQAVFGDLVNEERSPNCPARQCHLGE